MGHLQQQFKEARIATTKDAANKLSTAIYKGTREMGYKDEFVEHYSGKIYDGDLGMTHHEILTMGVESIFHEHNARVTDKDENYRHFIVGMLVGF